jgi:hypothetical protein
LGTATSGSSSGEVGTVTSSGVGNSNVGDTDSNAGKSHLSSTFASATSRWEVVDLGWQATFAMHLGEKIGRILDAGWTKLGEGWERAGNLLIIVLTREDL